MWNEILNQSDLDNFMEAMYGFHDSCLKEMKYISGAYVMENLSMSPVNVQRVLRVIIQRQFRNPSVLEMEFSNLIHLNLLPEEVTIISDATMLLKDNCIYWCDYGGLTEDDMDSYKGILICAEKLRWRAADEYLGPEEVYKSAQPGSCPPED